MARPGDWVRLKAMPPWVASLPLRSQAVFRFCLARTYRVNEHHAQGLFVLDVSADIDPRFGGTMNDIRVEEAYLDIVASPARPPDGPRP